MKLGELRENYTQKGLRKNEADSNPFQQFEKWMSEAQGSRHYRTQCHDPGNERQ
jgi:pyridoxine/pyridoxamine 5'-phosphate oxidase